MLDPFEVPVWFGIAWIVAPHFILVFTFIASLVLLSGWLKRFSPRKPGQNLRYIWKVLILLAINAGVFVLYGMLGLIGGIVAIVLAVALPLWWLRRFFVRRPRKYVELTMIVVGLTVGTAAIVYALWYASLATLIVFWFVDLALTAGIAVGAVTGLSREHSLLELLSFALVWLPYFLGLLAVALGIIAPFILKNRKTPPEFVLRVRKTPFRKLPTISD